MRKLASIALGALALTAAAEADTFWLRSGAQVEGTVKETRNGALVVETGSRTVVLRKSNIVRREENSKTGHLDLEAAAERFAGRDEELEEKTGLNAEQRRQVKAMMHGLQSSDSDVAARAKRDLLAYGEKVDLFKFFDHYVPSLSPRFAPHVLEIMAELNPRKSLKQLRKHAVDRAAVNRATSLELLGRLGDTRSAGLVAGGLIDHDATVRLAATEAAARLELREASPLLISNLNDADLRVQYASQDALALLWPHSEEEESPYKAGEWVRFWKEEAARKVARAYYPDDVAPLVKPGTEWEDE